MAVTQFRQVVALLISLCGPTACRESGRVDSTALSHGPSGPVMHVTILGDSHDVRVAPTREAIAHWSNEFRRLDRRLQFDSGTIRIDSIADDAVRAVQGEVMFGGGPATSRLLGILSNTPGDIVVIRRPT